MKRARMILLALLLSGAALGLSGCAVEGGYGTAYYAPDYGSYYGDYGYSDAPYPYFGGGDIVVGGLHHQRFYGHHHFASEHRGGFAAAAGRGPGGFGRGGGGGHGRR